MLRSHTSKKYLQIKGDETDTPGNQRQSWDVLGCKRVYIAVHGMSACEGWPVGRLMVLMPLLSHMRWLSPTSLWKTLENWFARVLAAGLRWNFLCCQLGTCRSGKLFLWKPSASFAFCSARSFGDIKFHGWTMTRATGSWFHRRAWLGNKHLHKWAARGQWNEIMQFKFQNWAGEVWWGTGPCKIERSFTGHMVNLPKQTPHWLCSHEFFWVNVRGRCKWTQKWHPV